MDVGRDALRWVVGEVRQRERVPPVHRPHRGSSLLQVARVQRRLPRRQRQPTNFPVAFLATLIECLTDGRAGPGAETLNSRALSRLHTTTR